MPVIGIGFFIFGILVIAVPELLSLIVGIFFILIGANIIFIHLAFNKRNSHSIKFGGYEIFRNKK